MPKPANSRIKVRTHSPGEVEFTKGFDPVAATITSDAGGQQATVTLEVAGTVAGESSEPGESAFLYLCQRHSFGRSGKPGGRTAAVGFHDGIGVRVAFLVDDAGGAKLAISLDGQTRTLGLDELDRLVRDLDGLDAALVDAALAQAESIAAEDGIGRTAEVATG